MKKYVKYIILILISAITITTITTNFLMPRKNKKNLENKYYNELSELSTDLGLIYDKDSTGKNVINITDKVSNLMYSIITSYYFQYYINQSYIYTKTDTTEEKITNDTKKFELLVIDNDFIDSNIDKSHFLVEFKRDGIYQIDLKEKTSKKIINIVNIDIGSYKIENEKLIIPDNTTYEEFKNQISLTDGLYIKVYNSDNQEITSGIINRDYMLKVYDYGNEEIDKYTIDLLLTKPKLDLSKLSVDEKNLIIKDLKIDTKISDIKSLISTNGIITVQDSKNNILTDSHRVKTGQTIEFKLNENIYVYKLSVLGDVNGDGELTEADFDKIYSYYKKEISLAKEYIYAGDFDNTNSDITILDLTKIVKEIYKN